MEFRKIPGKISMVGIKSWARPIGVSPPLAPGGDRCSRDRPCIWHKAALGNPLPLQILFFQAISIAGSCLSVSHASFSGNRSSPPPSPAFRGIRPSHVPPPPAYAGPSDGEASPAVCRYVYRVCRDMPKTLAKAAFFSPEATRERNSAACAALKVRFLPL